MQGSETTAQDLSYEPKTKALGENLTSVGLVESLFAKKWLAEKWFESCANVFES